MDAASLSELLSTSTSSLASLHAQLGHPPEALEHALVALHDQLRAAVDAQLGHVKEEVEIVRTECESIASENERLRTALGEKAAKMAEQEDEPLLHRRAHLTANRHRLRGLYASRSAQCQKLLEQLDTFRPIMAGFIKQPSRGTISAPSADGQQLEDVSLSFVAALEGEIARCEREKIHRSEVLHEHLLEIVALWSELCLAPSPESSEFDKSILAHLRLRMHSGPEGEFDGQFTSLDNDDESSTVLGSAEEDVFGPACDATPTRRSVGASAKEDYTLRLPALPTSQSSPPSTEPPSTDMDPTEENLRRAAAKRGWLEAEKSRREARIQELYDELSELWMRFDVPEEEMEAFVMDHRGSTMSVLEAYHAELDKMRELKTQHMALFISKTREKIAVLWDQLFLSASERSHSFPAFFQTEGTCTDELLAAHELEIEHLMNQIKIKAPVLKLVGRYRDLCEEGRSLDESAADSARLLGRGNRGDPGRLLREEKMRKRVKVQKPRLEEELQRVIHAWEEEHGMAFTMNGVRYLDELLEQIGRPKENGRKRTRTTSVSSKAGSLSTSQSGVLSSSHHQNFSGPTPSRPVTPAGPSTAKKARVASNMSTVSRTASRVPSASVGASVPAVPAVPSHLRTASYVGPSPRNVPLPDSPSKLPRPNPTPAHAGGGARSPSAMSNRNPAPAHAHAPPPAKGRQRFKPRPSGNLQAYTSVRSGQAGNVNHRHSNSNNVLSPSESTSSSQWSDMGPPRWPGLGSGLGIGDRGRQQEVNRMVSSMSTSSNVTTIVHPYPASSGGMGMGNGRHGHTQTSRATPRRTPSMSLESSLAALAAGSYQRETEHGADARSGAGGATIRAVSSESRPEPDTKGIQNWTASIPSSSSFSSISSSHASISASGSASGNNWAVLDEESDAEMFVDEGEGEGEGDETVLKLQDAVQV